ncbi:MAG: Gfo/Idh/MocA family oxidoreductase [Acetobacteraceae bacterium]|nr:Gfo/Idh/MocA family oxidoreductase [Acetobacteraceae bacterium]
MIGAAIVGLGWWGRHMVKSLAGPSLIRPVRLVDPAIEAARPFAEQHGLPLSADLAEALADPAVQAVILCTPQNLHTAQVLAAAAAGRHVFCEKPLAMTRADAEASVEACRRAGVVLGVGHERRFEPAMRRLREVLRAGRLGRLLHIEADFSHDKLTHLKPGDWRADPRYPAAHTGMGIHLTDAVLDLAGPVEEIYAAAGRLVSERENGDLVSVMLRCRSGATAFVSAILETPLYIATRVFGSQGWAEIRNSTHPDTPGPALLTLHFRDGTEEREEFAFEDAVRLNIEAFARAILGEEPYPFSDAEKIANVAILEAIARSVAERRPVAIAP